MVEVVGVEVVYCYVVVVSVDEGVGMYVFVEECFDGGYVLVGEVFFYYVFVGVWVVGFVDVGE